MYFFKSPPPPLNEMYSIVDAFLLAILGLYMVTNYFISFKYTIPISKEVSFYDDAIRTNYNSNNSYICLKKNRIKNQQIVFGY